MSTLVPLLTLFRLHAGLVTAIRTSLEPRPRPQPPPKPGDRRILYLCAGPSGEQPLALGRERQRLEALLAGSSLEVDFHSAATLDGIHEALLRRPYDLVHFSGHYDRELGLMLEDRCGHAAPFELGRFVDMLRRRSVGTLVLNACDSLAAIAERSDAFEFVVAMDGPLGDEAAVEFALGFYRALARDSDVELAFADARDLALGRRRDGIRPRLLGRRAPGSRRPPSSPAPPPRTLRARAWLKHPNQACASSSSSSPIPGPSSTSWVSASYC